MTLILQSAEVDRMAQDLAAVTGESIEQAVTEALRLRLLAERARAGELEAARAIVRRSGPSGSRATDHTAFLYDERGLPG